MKLTAATLAVVIGQATAWSWTDAPSFDCPSNSNDQCTSQQSSGFDWGSLATGSFDIYGGLSFSGFSCADSFPFRKRDLNERGSFQDKCITGSISGNSGPSISCGGGSSGFSIDSYEITVSEQVDVQFIYEYDSGETCSHTHTCSPGGTTVQNTQCGSAQKVSFQLSGSASCSIGIHNIGFSCGSTSPSSPASSAPVQSYSSPSPSSYSSPAAHASSSSQSSPAAPVSSSSQSSPAAPVSSSSSSSPAAPASSSSPAGAAPSSPCPNVLPQCLNTWISKTSCKDNTDCGCYCQVDDFTEDVIDCITAWGATEEEISAALSYLIGICAPWVPGHPGIVTNCPTSLPIGPTSGSSSTPVPVETTSTTVIVRTTVTTCPAGQTVTHSSGTTVLAQPSTSTVYITETSTICTKCLAGPTTTPPPSTAYTTITVTTSVTVPCSYTTGESSGQVIPSSSTVVPYSTCVTVPQVTFTTASSGSSASVGVVPQTSPTEAVVASSTPAAGVATTTGGYTTTLATSSTPKGSYSKNGTVTGTGSPAQVTTNAGVRSAASVLSLFVAAGVAALAL